MRIPLRSFSIRAESVSVYENGAPPTREEGGISPQRALFLVPLRRFLSENAAAIESRACALVGLSSRLPPRDTRDSQSLYRLEEIRSSRERNSAPGSFHPRHEISSFSPSLSIFSLGSVSFFRASLFRSSPRSSSFALVIIVLLPSQPPSPFLCTRFDRDRECVTDRISFRARGFWTPLPENSAVRHTGARR